MTGEGRHAVELTEQFIEDIDKRMTRLEHGLILRYLGLVIGLVVAGIALFHVQSRANTAARQAASAVQQIQQDRATGVRVNCAVISAFGLAGRQVIASGAAARETRFDRFLERHGYPPQAARIKQAEVAGSAYVAAISRRIDERVGRRGDKLVNRDGTVNCAELARLSGTR